MFLAVTTQEYGDACRAMSSRRGRSQFAGQIGTYARNERATKAAMNSDKRYASNGGEPRRRNNRSSRDRQRERIRDRNPFAREWLGSNTNAVSGRHHGPEGYPAGLDAVAAVHQTADHPLHSRHRLRFDRGLLVLLLAERTFFGLRLGLLNTAVRRGRLLYCLGLAARGNRRRSGRAAALLIGIFDEATAGADEAGRGGQRHREADLRRNEADQRDSDEGAANCRTNQASVSASHGMAVAEGGLALNSLTLCSRVWRVKSLHSQLLARPSGLAHNSCSCR